MERLGLFFEDQIAPLLTWMQEVYVGPALAGMITLAGLLVLFFLLRAFVSDQRLIDKAIAIIGDRNETRFAHDYNIINQDIIKIPKVGHAWSEFC